MHKGNIAVALLVAGVLACGTDQPSSDPVFGITADVGQDAEADHAQPV